jgi:hypothetical protein
MTASQMIAHLTDQMHHALGDSPVEARPGILRWTLVKYASIYILPWPKGRIKGPCEAFVTEPTTWSAEIAVLEELIPDGPDEWTRLGRLCSQAFRSPLTTIRLLDSTGVARYCRSAVGL